tara:strand:- start:9282 stop:10997 length:1716 start_codon:yes stop_codon:yes gene_type:complete
MSLYDPTKYGEEPYNSIEDEIEYGFKLTTDNDGQKNITLPQFQPEPLNVFQYRKNILDPEGENSQNIKYERLANFRPVSRPYGETILEDEKASIIKDTSGDSIVIYASKYLPRADELTAYVDLNTRNVSNENGKYDHDVYFPIRLGDLLETPTPSWTPTESWTPTISYTPTISETPTVSNTPTQTSTPESTPTPTDTKTPDLDSVGTIFRTLWAEQSNAYFTVKSEGGMFGMKFKYRKFVDDFYEKHVDGWFKLTGNPDKIFNPIRKIVLEVDHLNIPGAEDDGYVNGVYRDHEWVNDEATFNDINTGNTLTNWTNWSNMKTTNENTFEYVFSEGVKIHKGYESGSEVEKGLEFYLPFNESSFLSGSDERNERYDRFITNRETTIQGYDNPFDCVYFMFEGSVDHVNINDIKIYPSIEEQDGNSTDGWTLKDVPFYVSSEDYVISHGKNSKYLYSIETPTPTLTTTQTITETVSCTPTPTMTFTETISFTPTPTMTETITVTPTQTLTRTPTVTETITDTLNLFNINREMGVNIIGEIQIIKRDGTVTTASRFFNVGLEPKFIEFDGNVDI